MPLHNLDHSLRQEIEALKAEGRAKAPERIIVEYIPARGEKGPRYKLQGFDKEYLRMNSNSYLSLSNDPELIEAADIATRKLGVGLVPCGLSTGPTPITSPWKKGSPDS